MPHINQRFVDKLELGDDGARFWDDRLPRFGVRRGVRAHSFVIQFEVGGKTQNLTLGRSTIMGADAARKEATAAFGLLARGIDPREDKRKQKIAGALPGESWGELAEAFIEYQEGRGRKPRTIADYRKYLIRSGVIPLEQNVRNINREFIGSRVMKYRENSTPFVTRQMVQNLSSIISWLIAYSKLPPEMGSVCAPILATFDKPAPRNRILSQEEIKLLWQATDPKTGAATEMSPILRLLLLTGCRLTEITLLERNEVKTLDPLDWEPSHLDLKAERVKNGERHVVPLSEVARKILHDAPDNGSRFMFGTGNGYHGQSKGMRAVRAKMEEHLDESGREELRERIERLGWWKPHDLRRTAYTVMKEELLVADRVVALCFNHGKEGMARHYDQSGQGNIESKLAQAGEKAFNEWGKFVRLAVRS